MKTILKTLDMKANAGLYERLDVSVKEALACEYEYTREWHPGSSMHFANITTHDDRIFHLSYSTNEILYDDGCLIIEEQFRP